MGDLRDQDHVCPPGKTRSQCEPSDVVAHDLDHHYPVVRVSRGVETVDGIGGDPHGSVEAEGHVGPGDVVVDGLGDGEDRDPGVLELEGVAHRAVATETDQRLQPMLLHDLAHHCPTVHGRAVGELHPVHPGPARAEHGASPGQDPRKGVAVEPQVSVQHQALEAVLEADDLHPVGALGRFPDRSDRRVEPGAVTARGQDANGSSHRAMLSTRLRVIFRPASGGGWLRDRR